MTPSVTGRSGGRCPLPRIRRPPGARLRASRAEGSDDDAGDLLEGRLPRSTFARPSSRSVRIPCACANLAISSVEARSTMSRSISSVTSMTSCTAAAPVAGLRAVGATHRPVQRRQRVLVVHGRPGLQLLRGGLVGLLALAAQPPDESLREHAVDGRGHEERVDLHLGEPGHRRRRVVGVQRRQDEVAGERRLHADVRGLEVAHLTDEDDVGVLPQDRPQGGGERQAGLVVDLDLVDAGQPVLDRVLGRDDVDLGLVDDVQRRVERRATSPSRSGRSRGSSRRACDSGLVPRSCARGSRGR
jgi:hypothetical protein